MKTEWPRKRISEIAKHSLGKMLDKAKNKGDLRPYLRNLNVRWFDFDLSNLTEMRFLPDEEARYTVAKGDLVICEGGYPGRAAIWNDEQPIHFQKALHRVRFVEPHHAKWCLYYLQAEDLNGTLKRHFNGAGIQHFTGEALAKFELPLAPLAEQQRIVAILDEAFEGIATAKANAEKNLQNAKALFEGQSRSVFKDGGKGAAEQTLAELCSIDSKLVDPRDARFVDLTHVGAGNITSNTGDLVELKTAREEGMISGKFLFNESAVLYSKIRPYLKKVARPNFVGLCSADMYPLTARAGAMSRDYLFHLLMSEHFTAYAIAGSARAGMPKVNRDHLFAYTTTVPPLSRQIELAALLDQLHAETRTLEDIYQRKLAALDELKRSLLHQAFSGQLSQSPQASVAWQPTLETSTPEFTANVISLAHARHQRQRREKSFGHVKEQKILHLIESIAGVDLGRQPMRDAAGPNDMQHMRNAEKWAEAHGFFDMVKNGEGYEFIKLSGFDQHMSRAREALAPFLSRIEPVIDLLVPMDTEDAEIFTTVHAAWSNLVIDGMPTTDDAIVSAARDDWHPDKLKLPEYKFRRAIDMIREKKLVPDGTAKYVGGQKSLL